MNQPVQGKEMQAVVEQVREAKVPCASDSPDKGEAENIPGTALDFQQEDVDKGPHAYVKEDITVNEGTVSGGQGSETKVETKGIVMEGMSNTLTNGLDGIPNLKLKVDKARPDANPSGLSLSRPSTWTRINRMDFGLSGFTRAITLPTLGKRDAVHEADVCIEGNQGAPTLKRGKLMKLAMMKYWRGWQSTLAGSNESSKLELPKAWEPLDRSKFLQTYEGTSFQCLFLDGNKA